MRSMFSWATEEEEFGDNPTIGVKNISYIEKGHHAWTEEEVLQYEGTHKVARRRGLGLICCGTRRHDVRTSHASAGSISATGVFAIAGQE